MIFLISSIILLIAVFLDGMPSIFLSFLTSNLTLITLLLIYPIFIKNKKTYLLLLGISTLFYDLLYTNILLLNTTIIFCIYLLMEKYQKKINIWSLFGYFLCYHLVLFSLLYMIGYTKNPLAFISPIVASFIPNLIYGGILYMILKKYYPKKKYNE